MDYVRRRMKALSIVLLSASLAAALSGCPSAECSESEPCGEGFTCNAGVCVALPPDVGIVCPDNTATPNRLTNPGGEDGISGWTPHFASKITVASVDADVKCGKKAISFTANGPGEQHLWNDAKVNAGADETWCAQGWMRGTTTDGRLTVRRIAAGAGAGDDKSYSSPVKESEWTVVPPTKGLLKFTTSAAETLQLRVTMQFGEVGKTLTFDNIELWRSPDGSCTER